MHKSINLLLNKYITEMSDDERVQEFKNENLYKIIAKVTPSAVLEYAINLKFKTMFPIILCNKSLLDPLKILILLNLLLVLLCWFFHQNNDCIVVKKSIESICSILNRWCLFF